MQGRIPVFFHLTLLKKVNHSTKVLVGLAIGGFLSFFNIIGNTFLSDDYDSLYRICIEKRIIVKEFLRPLIDISFYLNYGISGLDPAGYYIFNIAIHILNAFLLYRFSLKLVLFEQKRQNLFAVGSAVLFLIYPFHSESIVWLSGRLSSIATLFALLSLNVWMGETKKWMRWISGVLFYLIGLLAYESILLLPVIWVVFRWKKGQPARQGFRYLIYSGLLIGCYLLFRFLISDAVYGGYGERMVEVSNHHYFLKVAKTLGRTVLPPADNATLLIAFSTVIASIGLLLNYWLFRHVASISKSSFPYVKLVISFFISILLPVLFGISTRTSEGDRLLYFPSLFVCMIIAYFLLSVLDRKIFQGMAFGLISVYFLYYLQVDNRHWRKASDASVEMISIIKKRGDRSVYVINLPDEIEGAYVFRNGFWKSLLIQGVDTSCVKVVNHLTRDLYLQNGGLIVPRMEGSNRFIFPVTRITNVNADIREITNLQEKSSMRINVKDSKLYFWDKEKFIPLF